MVRKTKAQAQATRCAILDAAERLFQSQGVSATSLQHIAVAAGVTRGAIYWHFTDKGDLFNAMMSRVCLPLEESAARLGQDADDAPLARLREHLGEIFESVTADTQVRRVLEIATRKVEYLDELTTVREHQRQVRQDYLTQLERALGAAQRRGEITATVPARELAIGVHALLDGLIQHWIAEPEAFDLQALGRRAVDLHLAGLESAAASAARP
jgi:TetR/AcrR family acrAB operon transcriptional repressor